MSDNLKAIKDELTKLAKAEETNTLKDVKASLEKLAASYAADIAAAEENAKVEARAQELVKKAFLGMGDSEDESIIELIKAYIAENPEVAAALGLGGAGAALGGGIGALAGGDLTSALAGAGLGGLAGGAAGYAGGEDLMDVFAAVNPEFTNELIKRAQIVKVAETLGVSPEQLAALMEANAALAEAPVADNTLIDELANMKLSAADEAAIEDLIKRAAYNDALNEVADELVKEAAYNDALAEVQEEIVKEAAAKELLKAILNK